MTSQAMLIANAKAGCSRSRGQLLEQYRGYLKTLARIQLPSSVRGKADASDLVQDAFLRAHKAFSDFRGTTDGELSVWLQRILASRLADVHRFHVAKKRGADLEQAVIDDLSQSSIALSKVLVHPGPSPSEMVSQAETARLVADAIEQLPPDYRTVILLKHVRGLPNSDVADEMKRSLDSVKKLWVRALAQLQRSLEPNT